MEQSQNQHVVRHIRYKLGRKRPLADKKTATSSNMRTCITGYSSKDNALTREKLSMLFMTIEKMARSLTHRDEPLGAPNNQRSAKTLRTLGQYDPKE